MAGAAPMLTVGIPTFERREIVCRRIADLIAAGVPERVEVLIVDDASGDGTHAALERLCADTGVRLLRNESNLGYAGNVLRLFEECRTPYLLVAADDDAVVADSLAPLEGLLEGSAPAFVSTGFRFGEELYRGGRGDRPIEPAELLAAGSHAPGLVYRVEECREALAAVAARLAAGSAAARVYPQVLILAGLLLAGRRCLWWERCAVEGETGPGAPTGIRDAAGAPYYDLGPRWEQVKDLLDFLAEEGARAGDPETAGAMAAVVEEGLFWRLRAGIEHERPDLLAAFDRSAARFYAGRWRLDSLRARARRAAGRLRSPGRPR
ncbi:MAG TPA: glycosyltransferase family 2 protein [Solirubrobacterales bacterium]|nr:glycosyltransferase family 2 protein [Solirubrobacterales bacterium]